MGVGHGRQPIPGRDRSLWYANVGHGRAEIRAAVAAQMERLEACSAFFDLANPPVLELAEALAERAPMPSKVFFNSGGSDGIDTAAKLARRYWWELGQPDRTVLISRTAAYHGTHGFGTALGGIPVTGRAWGRWARRSRCATTRSRRWRRPSSGSARSEWRRCSWSR